MTESPRITEIIKVEPFKVTIRWTTGQIRVIDFEQLFQQWDTQPDEPEAALFDYETFKNVSIAEEKTLHWITVPVQHVTFNDDTPEKPVSPLSFDPDVLYEASRPIDAFRLVPVD